MTEDEKIAFKEFSDKMFDIQNDYISRLEGWITDIIGEKEVEFVFTKHNLEKPIKGLSALFQKELRLKKRELKDNELGVYTDTGYIP